MKDKILKNIPNAITVSRMVSSLIAAAMFLLGSFLPSCLLYIYAAISDFLDGHFAKKFNAFSDLGRKLDAFSDKIFALALTLPAILNGNVLMLIPLLLEAKIGFYNRKVEKNGRKVSTKRIGKIKTAVLFPTMILGLISCKFLPVSILLVPALICSTSLQLKTYDAYLKDEENIDLNREVENSMSYEHEDIPIKDKIKFLKKELDFYLSCQDSSVEYKPKIKKRTDYNDRY